MKATTESGFIALSMITEVSSIWLAPILKLPETGFHVSSALLFMAGILFTIEKTKDNLSSIKTMETSIKNMEKELNNTKKIIGEHIQWESEDTDNAPLLQKISSYGNGDKPLYVRAASSVFKANIYDKILEDGITIAKYVQGKEDTISINHLTPAYDLMLKIINYLEENYVYIATTKLRNYGKVTDKDFKDFSGNLYEKSRTESILAIRLYYIEGKLEKGSADEVINDIKEARSNKVIVRYIELNSTEFDNKNDMAFLLAPPSNRSQRPSIDENSNEPFNIMLRHNNYETLCAIHFHLNKSDPSNPVTRMDLIKSSVQNAKNLKVEFSKSWRAARVFTEDTTGTISSVNQM